MARKSSCSSKVGLPTLLRECLIKGRNRSRQKNTGMRTECMRKKRRRRRNIKDPGDGGGVIARLRQVPSPSAFRV